MLEALRRELDAQLVAAQTDVVGAHHLESAFDVVDHLGQVAAGQVWPRARRR